MKKFFRHFLFLILCLSCYTASAGTDDNVGYIVGNSYGVGPSDQKWRETGRMAMLLSYSDMQQVQII